MDPSLSPIENLIKIHVKFANLAGGFDAFTDTDIDDDPREQ